MGRERGRQRKQVYVYDTAEIKRILKLFLLLLVINITKKYIY